MSKVRFHAGDIDLELSGSEPFVLRQLKLLSTFLGRVDPDALGEAEAPVREAAPAEPVPEAPSLPEPAPAEAREAAAAAAPAAIAEPARMAAPPNGTSAPAPVNGGGAEAADELLAFYRGFEPQDLDRQSDAALLFAYWLQQREGFSPLLIGDLIRCCIRAGVDTRNFNRTLGTLTRRGFLEMTGHGQGYRLSGQGVAAVESRM